MDDLFYNAFINGLMIIGVGILLTPIIRYVKIVRFLVAMYIALSFLSIMPDIFVTGVYMQGIIFCGMVIVIGIAISRLCNDAHAWSAGHFDVYTGGLSVLVTIFFVAILCNIMPSAFMHMWIAKDIYDLLVEYFFYVAILPLMYFIIFSKHLR